MKKKHSYRTTDVEHLDMIVILRLLSVGCLVSIDVAKTKFVVALTTAAGVVVKLLRFEHPRQTWKFLEILKAIRDANLQPYALMEPTGTCGDGVRHQIHSLGIPVHMMQSRRPRSAGVPERRVQSRRLGEPYHRAGETQ